jgi:hypothetical protein
MAFMVSGTPTQAFVDAVKAALEADTALDALITGVFGHLKETQRTAYPYIVLGRRGRSNDAGAMQLAGSRMSLQIDGWSAHQGASQMHAILSSVYAVLERQTLAVSGYEMVRGSLTCEFEDVFDEPDPDIPTRALYHGVQRWTCDIYETS